MNSTEKHIQQLPIIMQITIKTRLQNVLNKIINRKNKQTMKHKTQKDIIFPSFTSYLSPNQQTQKKKKLMKSTKQNVITTKPNHSQSVIPTNPPLLKTKTPKIQKQHSEIPFQYPIRIFKPN
ncbi:hypothetical protein QJS04_geneDACA000910 [Acorus gramineus]|uniref:Uncharacterized protein n=1 Tax=Acorus gramineus TaxID=55184 RepID=A0AAV9ACX7_ACOGR|nr:hypothetical protein QJS04_geneDACA000910 [Acorus gramineus]